MNHQDIPPPPPEIRAHGRRYELVTPNSWKKYLETIYAPVSGFGPYVRTGWQDESRTWLTIDEVFSTLIDGMAGRREAA